MSRKMIPKVSVIMPVYNGERFLREAIESVLEQTYENIQFIIVDDQSTDNSRSIIRSYADERIKTVFREKNGNVCLASNEAFSMIDGKYCALIGHDDVWRPDKIQKQVSYMEKNEECGVCFTRCNVIDQNNKIINKENFLFDVFSRAENATREDFSRKLIMEGNCLCAPSALFRVSTFNQVGTYKVSSLQLQDYDLWLRFLKISDVHILDEQLIEYRQILDETANLSAVNVNSQNRSVHEGNYIAEKYIYSLDNDLFIAIFNSEFVNKDSSSEEELLCERTFLLKKINNIYYLKHMMELLDNEKIFNVLQEKFDFNIADFYKENGGYIFWESGIFEYLQQLEKKVEQFQNLAQKQQKVLVEQESEIKKLKQQI